MFSATLYRPWGLLASAPDAMTGTCHRSQMACLSSLFTKLPAEPGGADNVSLLLLEAASADFLGSALVSGGAHGGGMPFFIMGPSSGTHHGVCFGGTAPGIFFSTACGALLLLKNPQSGYHINIPSLPSLEIGVPLKI